MKKLKTLEGGDIRDEINDYLYNKLERNYSWLKRHTDIPYGSIYSILKQKTMKVKKDDLKQINEAMGVNFIPDGKEGFDPI